MFNRTASTLRAEKRELLNQIQGIRDLEYQAKIDDLRENWEIYKNIPDYQSGIRKIGGLQNFIDGTDFSNEKNSLAYQKYEKTCQVLQNAISELELFYLSSDFENILKDIISKADSNHFHSDNIKKQLIANIKDK